MKKSSYQGFRDAIGLATLALGRQFTASGSRRSMPGWMKPPIRLRPLARCPSVTSAKADGVIPGFRVLTEAIPPPYLGATAMFSNSTVSSAAWLPEPPGDGVNTTVPVPEHGSRMLVGM